MNSYFNILVEKQKNVILEIEKTLQRKLTSTEQSMVSAAYFKGVSDKDKILGEMVEEIKSARLVS